MVPCAVQAAEGLAALQASVSNFSSCRWPVLGKEVALCETSESPSLGPTLIAIDGLALGGLERDLALLTALSTDRLVHFTWSPFEAPLSKLHEIAPSKIRGRAYKRWWTGGDLNPEPLPAEA